MAALPWSMLHGSLFMIMENLPWLTMFHNKHFMAYNGQCKGCQFKVFQYVSTDSSFFGKNNQKLQNVYLKNQNIRLRSKSLSSRWFKRLKTSHKNLRWRTWNSNKNEWNGVHIEDPRFLITKVTPIKKVSKNLTM